MADPMWRRGFGSSELSRVVDPELLAQRLAQQASEHAHLAIEHELRGEKVSATDCYCTAAALLERAALGSRHAGENRPRK